MKLTLHGVELEIENFTESNYKSVREVLMHQLANRSIKNRDLIKDAFSEAVQSAPMANPSDLWHHVVYRFYIELVPSYRHISDPGQSWRRASGEAFELFLTDYYNRLLARGQSRVSVVALINKRDQAEALKQLGIQEQVGSSKLDIAIMANVDSSQPPSLKDRQVAGGIHAKVSLAERVSDDVPASRAMMRNGHASFLVTLDVKSFPLSEHMSEIRAYLNRGELGTPQNPTDKRRYIEEHGDFDACFSFNLRTIPSPAETKSGKRIFICRFDGNWDALCKALAGVAK
jgi:hypothetical protein